VLDYKALQTLNNSFLWGAINKSNTGKIQLQNPQTNQYHTNSD